MKLQSMERTDPSRHRLPLNVGPIAIGGNSNAIAVSAANYLQDRNANGAITVANKGPTIL